MEIIDNKNGYKWEITKLNNNCFKVVYYEKLGNIWGKYDNGENCPEEYIVFNFGINTKLIK